MWIFGGKKAQPAPEAEPETCPTVPCGTCRMPMPIVAFDQACPRCRSRVPAAKGCPGGCGSCEMGKKAN